MRLPAKRLEQYLPGITPKLVESLSAAKTKGPVTEDAALALASSAVDAFAKDKGAVGPAIKRALVTASLADAAQRADMADLAATLGKASTRSRNAEQAESRMEDELELIDTKVPDELGVKNAGDAEMASTVASLESLAAAIGAPMANDFQLAYAPDTATGEPLPFRDLVDLDDEQKLIQILGDNALQTDGVLQNLTGKAGAAAKAGPAPTFSLSAAVEARIDRTLVGLRNVLETATRDTSERGDEIKATLRAPENALAASALGIAKNLADDPTSDARAAVKQLPVVIASLLGLKMSAEIVDNVMTKGVTYFREGPGNDALALQYMLEVAARVAGTMGDRGQANAYHSRAVALEGALTAIVTRGLTGEAARQVFAPLYQAFYKISFESAEQYYKPGGAGASASTTVAMGHAGEVLQAAHPGEAPPKGYSSWQDYAEDISDRLAFEDVDELRATRFGGQRLPGTGEEARARLGEKNKDDSWFVGHMTGRDDKGKAVRMVPTRAERAKEISYRTGQPKTPLTAAEKADALLEHVAAHEAWKGGQIERLKKNDQGVMVPDATRLDSLLRGDLYDDYVNVLRGHNDDELNQYVMIKDSWEIIEKGEQVRLARTAAQA